LTAYHTGKKIKKNVEQDTKPRRLPDVIKPIDFKREEVREEERNSPGGTERVKASPIHHNREITHQRPRRNDGKALWAEKKC